MVEVSDDVEYLKELPTDWWKSQDTVLIVGKILDRYGYIEGRMIWRFIEKPWQFQPLIDEFLKEWSFA